jgi:hypothetical protein
MNNAMIWQQIGLIEMSSTKKLNKHYYQSWKDSISATSNKVFHFMLMFLKNIFNAS